MLAPLDVISGLMKDAVCDTAAWTLALDSINSYVDGSGIVLLSVDERLKHAPTSTDLAEMMDEYFRTEWHANDRREDCRSLLIQKGIALDYEFLDVNEIENYHAQFLVRHDRKWFAGLGAYLDGDVWCLALQRSSRKGPFGLSDLPRLKEVQALFEEAAGYARSVARHWVNGAFCALDSSRSAAVLLDRSGSVLQTNEAAQSIITGWQADRRGVTGSTHARSLEAFEHLLRSKLLHGPRIPGELRRASFEIGQRVYALEATCLWTQASLAFSKASVLVLIRPEIPDPAVVLKNRFGLTAAETRIATALTEGLDVKAMAEKFFVKTDTVRTHLKSAYAKTNTGSQAKLTALLAQLSHRH